MNFSEEALVIEENGAEFLMMLGRAAGAEERDDGRVRWAIGNSPIDYHNCVVHADLTQNEADREIEASLQRMREHEVPGSWHVGPSMRPPDLGWRLIAHGLWGTTSSRRSKYSIQSTVSGRNSASRKGADVGQWPKGLPAWCVARRCSESGEQLD